MPWCPMGEGLLSPLCQWALPWQQMTPAVWQVEHPIPEGGSPWVHPQQGHLYSHHTTVLHIWQRQPDPLLLDCFGHKWHWGKKTKTLSLDVRNSWLQNDFFAPVAVTEIVTLDFSLLLLKLKYMNWIFMHCHLQHQSFFLSLPWCPWAWIFPIQLSVLVVCFIWCLFESIPNGDR